MDDSAIHAFLSINPEGSLLYSQEKGEKSIPIAIQRIQTLAAGDPMPAPKMTDNRCVALPLTDRNGQNIQAEVKIDQVARLIGRSEEETKSAIQSGQLRFTPEHVTEVLKNEAIKRELPKYGLSESELNDIEEFYKLNGPEMKERAQEENGVLFVRRQEINDDFPRSLVYIAEGPKAGCYVILKTHGGIDEIGVGGHHTATLCFNLDTGKKAIFRTGKAQAVPQSERDFNEIVSKYPEDFAGGIPISNEGPTRQRDNLPKVEREQRFPRELNVDKMGFIMDYYEEGTLFDKLDTNHFSDKKEKALFASSFAASLDKLHTELKIVNLDLKPDNTLIGADGRPRIADWGLAWDVGEEGQLEGSEGYMAPELVWAKYTGFNSSADPKMDVWSMGCLFSQIFNSSTWMNNMGILLNSEAGFDKYDMDPKQFEVDMKSWFPGWDKPDHPDSVIYDCLKWEPAKRITAKEAALRLKAIADKD